MVARMLGIAKPSVALKLLVATKLSVALKPSLAP